MRYAVRTLLKTPAFSAVAIATIALGIAANTAIFSVVNGVLLRPLPFPDESRIVQVTTSTADERKSNHSAGEFLDIQRMTRSLTALAGYRIEVSAVSVGTGAPAQVPSAWVTSEFFDVLGAPPALGRTFTKSRDTATGEKLVILSHPAWQQFFGGDTGVIGRAVRVNGQSYVLTGVMGRGVEWPQGARMWLLSPAVVPPSPIEVKDPLTNRDVRYMEAIGRITPGITLAAAREDLHAVAVNIQQQQPGGNGGREVRAAPIREALTGNVREALLMIQVAVGLVLLIACANVSSLLIARATSRRRELAIRAALGASRGHLVRQLLAESVVLGIGGGIVGLLASSWLVGVLLKMVPEELPQTNAIGLDTTVAVAAVALSLLTGMLFGILPALQASRTQAAAVIKESGERGSTRARGRAVLVVAEIALTLVLLVGAGLLANSFLRLQRVESGFRPEHTTIAELTVPLQRYPKGADQTQLYRRLLEGLQQRPGFEAVAVGFPGPFRANNASASFFIEGRTSTGNKDRPFAHIGTVSGGYFSAMGIPLLSGRTFDDRDREKGAPVGVVNVALAKRYWPNENPVGKRLRFEDTKDEPWFTVVGLVADTRQLGLSEEPPPLLYIPFEQFALPFTSVVVRSNLATAAVSSELKAQLATIDRDMPFGDIMTLESVVTKQADEPRFRAVLIGAFALLALLLAAVGIYGLISYTVTQRTREIGIRVALGAAPRQVLIPVVREGLMLALAGIGIGLVGAFLAARALTSFLFGVQASDPVTFAGVAFLLLAVALLASYLPSRRAMKVDPVVALRH